MNTQFTAMGLSSFIRVNSGMLFIDGRYYTAEALAKEFAPDTRFFLVRMSCITAMHVTVAD